MQKARNGGKQINNLLYWKQQFNEKQLNYRQPNYEQIIWTVASKHAEY